MQKYISISHFRILGIRMVNKVLSTKIFINQGAQDSQIPEIVMEVFAHQGKPEKP